MNLRIFRRVPARKRGLFAVLAAAVAASTSLAIAAGAGAAASAAPAARADQGPGEATGLGQLTGLLPASHLTLESAIQVNLSNETVRLPLYPGIANEAPAPGDGLVHPGGRLRRRAPRTTWA